VGQNFFEVDDLDGEGNNVIGFISGIKKANIYLLPEVGNILITKANLISSYTSEDFCTSTVESKTYINEVLVADCIIHFLILEVQGKLIG
jgi:hypothetical protein